MATNLTGSKIKDTYAQVLHVDGGVNGTDKTVYGGTGTASALRVSTSGISVGNIRLSGSALTPITGGMTITNAAISGGSVTGITDLAVADGGTGASTALDARANLGLGTIATQNANDVTITGGAISNVTFTGSFSGITSITSGTFAATGALGYVAGAGDVVTQLTSKSTAVTLNKRTGKITTHNATLNRNTSVSFTLNNTLIGVNDVIMISVASGATAGAYGVYVDAVAAGSCQITLHNHLSGTDLGEALVLNFVVITGAAS